MDSSEVSGIDRAAILLMSIGVKEAGEVLKHLGQKEIQQVVEAMSSLKDVHKSKVSKVITDFINNIQDQTSLGVNNDEQVRELLINALGKDKARGLIDKILVSESRVALDSLKWMEPKAVYDLIHNEHPRIQAIILSYLDPELSGKVIAFFDEKYQMDIIMRITNQNTVHPEALDFLNKIIEEQSKTIVVSKERPLGGVKRVADILNNVDPKVEVPLFEQIKKSDPDIAEAIADLMLIFENLKEVDDRGIQAILREVSSENLILALKGSDNEMKEKIFSNMSKRAGELLKEDLEVRGPVKLKDVEAAQKEIVAVARRMAEEGKINLGKGGEEMV